MDPRPILDVDPFDLPGWMGTDEVTWTPLEGLRTGHHVSGVLSARGHDEQACDLLGVDEAYPAPVTDDASRARAHQAWRHDQVFLGEYDGRLTLAVPGTSFGADLVLESLARLAKAVGASPERYAAHLRIGAQATKRPPDSR